MNINYLFFSIYIKSLIDYIRPNIYYKLLYDTNSDVAKIINVTFYYYLLSYLCLRHNSYALYFIEKISGLDLDSNLIILNNNKQLIVEGNNKFKSVIPKGIINNIIIDVKNHRYNLDTIKKNLFKIDVNIPLIFCLLYYENICKINDCYISTTYLGKKLDENKFTKIISIDTISKLI